MRSKEVQPSQSKEPDSPVHGAQVPEPAEQEQKADRNMTCGQPADEEDSLDEGILDEGGHLMPTDDLALPEDDYLLGLEYTEDKAEEMVMSPPRPSATEFIFTKPAADVRPLLQPATPAVIERAPCPAEDIETQLSDKT